MQRVGHNMTPVSGSLGNSFSSAAGSLRVPFDEKLRGQYVQTGQGQTKVTTL